MRRWGRSIGDREARRVAAVIARLDRLGPHWHIVKWPHDEPTADIEAPGFLAVGPGGVYAVTVVDHGRARIVIATDVVYFNGKHPAYVAEARRKGRRAHRALSGAAGLDVPVHAVLAIVGTGLLSLHGLPKNVLVATDRQLDRLLITGGTRISPATAARLATVAADPTTWTNAPYRPADHERP